MSFTQLLIQYQDDIAGFNKSEAYILYFLNCLEIKRSDEMVSKTKNI